MMHDLSASKWRYMFLLLLVDRGRDAAKLIFRTLWPEREWLSARYGRYTFITRLRHLLDAARGKI
jgi:two-component SAPR family response regulator